MAIPALELLRAENPIRATAKRLARRAAPPPLVPAGPYDAALAERLRALDPERTFGDDARVASPHDAMAVVSGLLLWNDSLTESHTLSQGIETSNGSYWHGIVHRREPDYSNSKYWFRRVGPHPIFPALHQAALEALRGAGHGFRWASETTALLESRGEWDPHAFVDWCQACEQGVLSPQTRAVLEQIQLREMEILLDHCLRGALGA
jgi:hypothetical protein